MKKRWIALIILTAVIAGIGFGAALNYREAKANNSREAALSAEKQRYEDRTPTKEELAQAEAERKRVELTTINLTKFTNDERVKFGLNPVTENVLLDRSAQAKCNDMVARDYWEHNTPDGVKPWQFVTDVGYSYSALGENLAYGFNNSDEVVKGWMNSPKHKDNIVKPNYLEVGFGICRSDDYNNRGKQTIVVQHFGRPYGI